MRWMPTGWLCSVSLVLVSAWTVLAADPPAKVSPPAGEFEIPKFVPPEKTDSVPVDASAIPLIARIREQAGSPLESAAWQPLPGASPLKVASRVVVQPGSASSELPPPPPVPPTNEQSPPFSPDAPTWPQLTVQIRNLASSLEKSAEACEVDGQFERADELRKMAGQFWKQARVLQGWSESP